MCLEIRGTGISARRRQRAEIIWTEDDIAAVRSVAEPEDQAIIDAIELASVTGLRREDLAKLTWGKVQTFAIDIRGTFATRLMTTTDLTDEEAAEIMGWSPERGKRIRKVYVSDHARTLALGKRIALGF